MIFVDTSAFLAILQGDDRHHQRADSCLRNLREEGQTLRTNNYVIVESMALIQKRLGLEKARDFQEKVVPLLEIEWIDEDQHNSATEMVFRSNQRRLSLVDCSSFQTMKRLGIDIVFTFDKHFREQGFTVIP